MDIQDIETIARLQKILEEIHDEADHIVGSDIQSYDNAIEDAVTIKGLAREGLNLL